MGPIPAGAGEPKDCRHPSGFDRAYPCGRGGTGGAGGDTIFGSGLSPRARGNHRLNAERAGSGGPIPAGAGEPR